MASATERPWALRLPLLEAISYTEKKILPRIKIRLYKEAVFCSVISIVYLYNVRPCDARRTPSRDEPTIRTLKVPLSQVYKDMVGERLFYSHFSYRIPVCNKDYRGVGHNIARLVDAINHRFSSSPLLNHDYSHNFDFRNHSIIVL